MGCIRHGGKGKTKSLRKLASGGYFGTKIPKMHPKMPYLLTYGLNSSNFAKRVIGTDGMIYSIFYFHKAHVPHLNLTRACLLVCVYM